jgi:hypothetical protein
MFKKLFVTFIASLFLLTGAFAQSQDTCEGVCSGKFYKEDLKKYTMGVFHMGKFGVGYCSGTLVYESEEGSIILTAKHCIPSNEELYAGQKRVKSIRVSAVDDLALLIVEGEYSDKEPAKFAAKNEPVGNTIYYLGYPPQYELEGYYDQGPIVRYTQDWAFAKVLSIGGCSGTGVFNKDLELIGVLWGGTRTDMIFEPVEDIKLFFEELR